MPANRLADRTRRIAPFHVMGVLASARAMEAGGRSVISLFVGEPDFGTPQAIVRAGQQALADGHTGYTAATGIPALREAIADRYQRWHGIALDPRRVVVTPGGSSALLLAFAATVDPGKSVLLPEPGYPCNRHFLQVVNGHGVSVPLSSDGLRLDIGALDAAVTDHTTGLLLASPCNPTGQVLSRDEWVAASDFSDNHNLTLFADEIYHGLSFTGSLPPTALEVNNEAWITQSFSKFYGMTGWRLGWVVVPDFAIDVAERLAQNLFLSAPAMAQQAALSAFTPDVEAECFARASELRARRDALAPAIEALGLPLLAQPDGAFYLYVDVSSVCDDATHWCQQVLEETGVAIAPGLDFGGATEHSAVRIAYTVSISRLEEAVQRIGDFLARHPYLYRA